MYRCSCFFWGGGGIFNFFVVAEFEGLYLLDGSESLPRKHIKSDVFFMYALYLYGCKNKSLTRKHILKLDAR